MRTAGIYLDEGGGGEEEGEGGERERGKQERVAVAVMAAAAAAGLPTAICDFDEAPLQPNSRAFSDHRRRCLLTCAVRGAILMKDGGAAQIIIGLVAAR